MTFTDNINLNYYCSQQWAKCSYIHSQGILVQQEQIFHIERKEWDVGEMCQTTRSCAELARTWIGWNKVWLDVEWRSQGSASEEPEMREGRRQYGSMVCSTIAGHWSCHPPLTIARCSTALHFNLYIILPSDPPTICQTWNLLFGGADNEKKGWKKALQILANIEIVKLDS